MLYMFDIDGTLIKSFIVEKPQKHGSDLEASVYDIVELLPNRLHIIQQIVYRDPRACFALITNQGGVAFGFQTKEQVRAKMAKVVSDFYFFYTRPFSVHICFYHPKATVSEWLYDDPRRKPKPGMLYEAMEAHNHRDKSSVFVGDLVTDKQAAEAAGVAYQHAEGFFT